MKSLRTLALFIIVLFGFLMISSSQAPELINYQGRLLGGSVPFNGSSQVVFRLYDLPMDGTFYYTETQTVDVVNGFYSTNPGLSNAAPLSLLHGGACQHQTITCRGHLIKSATHV